uniref:CS domain-containing protein n=1 Tax=Ciona savignyi TaxID=51511 RepID=H2YLS3_CIOSA
MMPQANENLRVSVTKRNNESHRKRKKEVVEKNPIRMSWSQRGHDVYVILWKTADILRLEDVEILLSDTTCTITSPNCDELGWNLFLEVDSSKSQRVQAKNTILIIIPKKDPTVFWTSLKKTKSMSPKFSIDPPPHKVFLESPEEDAHSKVFKVPSLQTPKNSPTNTMATGTVVSLGILKGGNRPLSHCGSATDEMHTIDNVEVQKSSSNTSQDVTEIKGLLHKFDSTVGSSLKIPPKDYVTVEVHLRQDDITDLKIQFYQMTVSVQFQ